MRHKLLMVMLSVALIVSLVLTGCAEPAAPRRFLGGSTALTSSFYAAYATFYKVGMEYVPGLTFTQLETGGSADNFKRVNRGEIDCGPTNFSCVYAATRGEGKWEGDPQPNNVRVLFKNGPGGSRNVFWARADSGITCVADLEGKKFYSGMPGSASQTSCEYVLEKVLNIHIDPFVGSLSDAVAAIKDGRCDGLLKQTPGQSTNVGATITDLLTSTELNLFGLTDEEAEKVRAELKWIPILTVPAGFYHDAFPDAPEMNVLSDCALFITIPEFPEDIAYAWTKAVAEHQDEIYEGYRYDDGLDLVDQTIPAAAYAEGCYLHPGAIRYYREMGAEIPECVIPPEMK